MEREMGRRGGKRQTKRQKKEEEEEEERRKRKEKEKLGKEEKKKKAMKRKKTRSLEKATGHDAFFPALEGIWADAVCATAASFFGRICTPYFSVHGLCNPPKKQRQSQPSRIEAIAAAIIRAAASSDQVSSTRRLFQHIAKPRCNDDSA